MGVICSCNIDDSYLDYEALEEEILNQQEKRSSTSKKTSKIIIKLTSIESCITKRSSGKKKNLVVLKRILKIKLF